MKARVEDYNEEDKKEDNEEDIPSRFDTVPPMDLHQELLWLHKSFDLLLKRKN